MSQEDLITFETSFEPFKGYIDQPLELIEDPRWTRLAKQVLNETPEKRAHGILTLKKLCQDANLQLPFSADEKGGDLEHKFWLMVLRAGGMDPAQAFKVLQNYLNILLNHPQYFASSKPPTKMDFIFQQQVNFKSIRKPQFAKNQSNISPLGYSKGPRKVFQGFSESKYSPLRALRDPQKVFRRPLKGPMRVQIDAKKYFLQIHLMLQHRDQHGRRVYIYRPGRWNPDKVSFDDVFCCGYALSELVSLETK